MSLVLGPEWGPYTDINDARVCLTRFVDRACGPDTGIVWTANGSIYPLRAPKRDGDGIGTVSIFEWNKPPPIPRPPSGFLPRARAFIERVLEAEGRAAIARGRAEQAMGQAMTQVLGRVLSTHRDDGVGVALDVVCVVLSLALIPTGLTAIGVIALGGGIVLLAADGGAYGLEMSGNETRAEEFKKATERFRVFATIMTLPDVAYGGARLARELIEMKDLRALDMATAASALTQSARAETATRADRLQQLAARANLRAQIRSEQIAAALRLDGTGKLAGSASIGLLIREEVGTDDSAYSQFLRYLQIHCAAVNK